jgi:hypothetical protein
MADEDGDCEVVSGSMGEEGCQIDLASFYVYPCYSNEMAFFEVQFNSIPTAKTWDVCFTINADNDHSTGFQDPPANGVDRVYCWGNEEQLIVYNQFGPSGDYLNEIPVSDPQSYVMWAPDGTVITAPFGMTYPPPDTVDPEGMAYPQEIYAEGHYYNPDTGDWVWDRAGPVYLDMCPPQ